MWKIHEKTLFKEHDLHRTLREGITHISTLAQHGSTWLNMTISMKQHGNINKQTTSKNGSGQIIYNNNN
jgi:hypothetical protein